MADESGWKVGDWRVTDGKNYETFTGERWVRVDAAKVPDWSGPLGSGSSGGSSGVLTVTDGTSFVPFVPTTPVPPLDALDELGRLSPTDVRSILGLDTAIEGPIKNKITIKDGQIILNGMRLPDVLNYHIEKSAHETDKITIELRGEVEFDHVPEPKSEPAIDFMEELKSL